MARGGAVEVVEHVLEEQVERVVATSAPDDRTLVYTDMFDQVFWSKRPTHAGPIGNRGNRILGATYFGLTFVRTGEGPLLAYHASWHKPAAPLLDALQRLYASDSRKSWLRANADIHIWDRGGAGTPVLEWAMSARIPFFTVMRGSVRWTDYVHPTTHTPLGVPVFVRPDATLFDWGCFAGEPVPREIIFPAHPEKADACTKALRYKTTANLNPHDLRSVDQLYKTRWPNNENAIKDLLSAGFDRNLDRTLVTCTSRGADGRLQRLAARRGHVLNEIDNLERQPVGAAERKKIAARKKKLEAIAEQSNVTAPDST
jgi:hypothetical protein